MLFQQCQAATANWPQVVGNGFLVKQAVQAFMNHTGLDFPLLNPNYDAPHLNPIQLATAIGYLSGRAYTDTFISYNVDTNWKNTQGKEPYKLYVDQSTLGLAWTFYINKTWDHFKDGYKQQTMGRLDLQERGSGFESRASL